MKNIAKVKTDKAIEKALAHWNRQPNSKNKARQMTYLQNLVASQYEAIDGMQAFGLPVDYVLLLNVKGGLMHLFMVLIYARRSLKSVGLSKVY